ncbi:hypothetical protein GALMADRAFT_257422 [Galerina marginata CBS 339.88]|uniref:Uncharacterized protein n=1 Tax=Galerina marginata (strain CBS 339.88) TaxID=685588 RepID=A0A067SMH2_GALM3|nr:hypothetical protein GALMADRAFT_257422 [Galerina marginata CBS 339.88]
MLLAAGLSLQHQAAGIKIKSKNPQSPFYRDLDNAAQCNTKQATSGLTHIGSALCPADPLLYPADTVPLDQ